MSETETKALDEPMAEFVARCLVPFPENVVGVIPRIWCKDCSNGRCSNHAKQRCKRCGNNISEAHVDLDYVGHAEITARLLELDPIWNWEPVAFDDRGQPMVNTEGSMASMWIRLTICGVTRFGVGTAAVRKDEVLKELIGDALRNAAMRFGIALALWTKDDLDGSFDEADPLSPGATAEQFEQITHALYEISDMMQRDQCKKEIREIFGEPADILQADVPKILKFVGVFEYLKRDAGPPIDPGSAPEEPEPVAEEPATKKRARKAKAKPKASKADSEADPKGGISDLYRVVMGSKDRFDGVRTYLDSIGCWPLTEVLAENEAEVLELVNTFLASQPEPDALLEENATEAAATK